MHRAQEKSVAEEVLRVEFCWVRGADCLWRIFLPEDLFGPGRPGRSLAASMRFWIAGRGADPHGKVPAPTHLLLPCFRPSRIRRWTDVGDPVNIIL